MPAGSVPCVPWPLEPPGPLATRSGSAAVVTSSSARPANPPVPDPGTTENEYLVSGLSPDTRSESAALGPVLLTVASAFHVVGVPAAGAAIRMVTLLTDQDGHCHWSRSAVAVTSTAASRVTGS